MIITCLCGVLAGVGWDSAARKHADFVCAITNDLMRDPVVAANGHSYERAAMERWMATPNGHKDPLTGLPLANTNLIPNHTLKKAILNAFEREKQRHQHEKRQRTGAHAGGGVREA